MQVIFSTILLLFFLHIASAQNFGVNIPDTISVKLKVAYELTAINSGAENNVFNLSNYNNYNFGDGIYSFKGMGPHYPRRVFIYENKKLYIFNAIGAFDPIGFLNEYIMAIEYLNLDRNKVVSYLSIISLYLKDESQEFYGREIK